MHQQQMGQNNDPRFRSPMQNNIQQNNSCNISYQQVMTPNGLMTIPVQVVMTPNGPMNVPVQQVMTPNGPMWVPIQNNMPYGSQVYPNNNMLTGGPNMEYMQQFNTGFQNVNRFGNTMQAINTGLSITSTENSGMDSRYRQTSSDSKESQIYQSAKENRMVPTSFMVNIKNGITFGNNKKVKLNTFIDEIKSSSIRYINDGLYILNCFEEAINEIIEYSIDKEKADNKVASVQQFIVTKSFYKTSGQDNFNNIINDSNIKSVYKMLKKEFQETNNKYDINLLNTFDTLLTDYVNDFVKINANIDVSIDSFMSDFNDLLKVIRDNEEDLEDSLTAYMNKIIVDIKENIDIATKANENVNEDEHLPVVYLPESCSVCYVDKFSYELGIEDAPDMFALVEDIIPNKFITSLSNEIFDKLKCNNFYLVTIDRFIVKLETSISGKLFLKKVM